MGLERIRSTRSPSRADRERDRHLAQRPVRHAHHGAVDDRGMGVQGPLYLGGIDVSPPRMISSLFLPVMVRYPCLAVVMTFTGRRLARPGRLSTCVQVRP